MNNPKCALDLIAIILKVFLYFVLIFVLIYFFTGAFKILVSDSPKISYTTISVISLGIEIFYFFGQPPEYTLPRFSHKWNRWNYESENSCNMIRVCTICGATEETKARHVWDEWKHVSDRSCNVIRTCTRCKLQENDKKPHIWTKWRYEFDNKCNAVRTCTRCGQQENDERPHIWSEWEYDFDHEQKSVISCDQVRACKRCGYKQSRTKHQFSDWVPTSHPCIEVRTCIRCAKVQETGHEFRYIETDNRIEKTDNQGEVEWYYVHKCEIYKCSKCGETYEEYSDGYWIESYRYTRN